MNTNLYPILRVYFECLMWTQAIAFATEMVMLTLFPWPPHGQSPTVCSLQGRSCKFLF